MQDTEKMIQELRSTLEEVVKERYVQWLVLSLGSNNNQLYVCGAQTGIVCAIQAPQLHDTFKLEVACYNCRDQLKAQLDHQPSPGDVDLTDTSLFRFRSKTLATVAANNRLSSGNYIEAGRIPNGSTTLRQGRTYLNTTLLGHHLFTSADNPPPKPKRPPKELLNRYSHQQEQQQRNSPLAKPVNILQTLFGKS